MKRRDFIVAAIGGSATMLPFATHSQQPSKNARVGYLGSPPTTPMVTAGFAAFSSRMRQLGWIEGQNLTIEHRYVYAPGADLATQAAELVKSKVDVIVASGTETALQAALRATRTIPIAMMAINFDPIERGYVASLARPGGNVTGLFFRQLELAQKQFELLAEAFPERTRIASLYDGLSADQFEASQNVARQRKLQFSGLMLENPPYDFDHAFRELSGGTPQMLLVLSSPFFTSSQSRIASLAIERRWPTMFIFKSYVEAGGLMSYGVDYVQMQSRLADYVGKILAGAKPADLPVEQPTKFELVINLKTAKALDVEVSPTLLARADSVVE